MTGRIKAKEPGKPLEHGDQIALQAVGDVNRLIMKGGHGQDRGGVVATWHRAMQDVGRLGGAVDDHQQGICGKSCGDASNILEI